MTDFRRLGKVAKTAALSLSVLVCLATQQSWAQIAGQAVLIPNYDRIPIGELGGLEGGAMTARADDASSAWYNPAGLVKTKRDSVSGNATIYEVIETQFGPNKTTGLNSIPNFVGSKSNIEDTDLAWGFSVVTPIHFETTLAATVDGITLDVSTFVDENERLVPVNFAAQNVEASFESASKLSNLTPGLAVGWALSESVRLGAGARLHRVTFEVVDSRNFRQNKGATGNYANFLHSSDTTWNASADLVTLEFGVQWDIWGPFTVGAVIRSPSQLLASDSDFNFSSVESFSRDKDGDDLPDTVQVVSVNISGDNGDFNYRLPQEISVGIAYQGDYLEVEIDIRRHEALSTFSVFGGGSQITIDSRNHEGAAQDQNTRFSALQYSAKQITNTSLGIKYKATESFWLHFGAFRDNSPVGDTNDIFDEVDFTGITFGGTLRGENTSTSLGVVRVTGESPDTEGLGNLEITTTAFSLSGSYYF